MSLIVNSELNKIKISEMVVDLIFGGISVARRNRSFRLVMDL